MVFFANLCVNLHVCLCGDLEVASAQTLDFLDIGKKSSFPGGKPGGSGSISGWETGWYRGYYRMDIDVL